MLYQRAKNILQLLRISAKVLKHSLNYLVKFESFCGDLIPQVTHHMMFHGFPDGPGYL